MLCFDTLYLCTPLKIWAHHIRAISSPKRASQGSFLLGSARERTGKSTNSERHFADFELACTGRLFDSFLHHTAATDRHYTILKTD